MTGVDLYKWIADPSVLDRDSLPQLQELVRRYPYFRSAQLLLAKNLKVENHIDQRRQLHLAAVYASDRKLLFGLIEGTHPPLKDVGGNSQHTTEREGIDMEVVASKEEIQIGVLEPVDEDIVSDYDVESPLAETPSLVLESGSSATEIIGKEEEDAKNVIHSSLYDLIPEPLIYRIEDAVLPELAPVEVSEDEPATLSFDQWLDRIGRAPGVSSRVTPRVSRPANSKDNLALIADFLAAQPKEGRTQRAEFFKPSKAAERSNQQEFSVISETLANIYEQQGKYELAVKAFDSLAVKYPEKSSYFAARKMTAQEKLSGHSD